MNETSLRPAASGRGLGAVLLAAMLLGTVGVTTRQLYAISAANPLSIAFFRLAIGTPVLAIVCGRMLGRRAWRIARPDLALMLLLGATLGSSQALYFTAIAASGVTAATLITLCTSPILVTIGSSVLLREQVTPATLLALLSALGGTALLVGLGQPGGAPSGLAAGALASLGAALCYSVFTLASRHLAQRYHPLQTLTVGFAVGSILLLILALAGGLVVDYPPAGWAMLLYLGTIPSALAYSLFLAGIGSITATLASISALVEPLTATLLAWLIFGEKLGPFGILGAVLLLAAILVLYRAQRTPQAELPFPE